MLIRPLWTDQVGSLWSYLKHLHRHCKRIPQVLAHHGYDARPISPLVRCTGKEDAQKGLQQGTITSKQLDVIFKPLVDVQTNVDKCLNSMTIKIGEDVYTS